ncbi:cardiolipin synthase [Aliidiomarina halalkaliphila]|uniref:Cardiolipin synthase n=1 Tax=Aliidiomarina halalkaliphila TaxID=2593535 RepID=A0A552X553_9GAMM|nr:cardiolipin synthase [Aliidiomarina halalkaliphila]TRW49733.1 cardiolipin synthase [Aliidiomarina halalkaliphila]
MQLTDLIVVLYWLLIASVFLRIIFKRRPVSASLAWVLIIVIIPLLGALIYLFFGEVQLGKRRAERAAAMHKPFTDNFLSHLQDHKPEVPSNVAAGAIYNLMKRRDGIGAFGFDNFSVLSEPDAIFDAWIADIRKAEKSIRMEFYIWHPHGRVNEVTDALIAAAERGVSVEILVDHAGSWRFFFWSRDLKRMRGAGIEFLPALPVNIFRNLFRRADLRLHRKMLLIDHYICYSGSMNMVDPRYFNVGRRFGPWIDMVIRFEGAAAFGVSKVFSWDWELETGDRRFPELENPLPHSKQWLSIIPSGPGTHVDVVHQLMLSLIHRADQSLIIATPYFVPSEAIYEALVHAGKRGIDVCILLPAVSDSRIAAFASRSYYENLLAAGVQIRLFDKGLLHSKAMVVDGELAIVGSMNVDMRSLQLNFELSFALYNEDSCNQVCQLLHTYKEQSTAIDYERWKARSRLHRAAERFMYFLSPLL